jgi:hypothetical protein
VNDKAWIVFTGDYAQRGSIGPAFTRREDAEVFAADFGNDIEEFELHTGTPVRMTHYQCQGWLPDVKNTVNAPNDQQDGFRLYRHSYPSWDVLTPEPVEVRTAPWSAPHDSAHNYAEASGRDEQEVRAACVEALKKLAASRAEDSHPGSDA